MLRHPFLLLAKRGEGKKISLMAPEEKAKKKRRCAVLLKATSLIENVVK